MAADLATLAVRVTQSGIAETTASLKQLEGAGGQVQSRMAGLKSAVLAAGAAFGAAWLGRKFITETIEAQNATAQLEARLRSMGTAAGQTLPELQAYATRLQALTTFSDEAVQSAQALLLSFGNIRGETFRGATDAVLDLATAMGGDLKGAALQVGKALQDPEQGLLALRRSGVSFSDEQQKVIKALFDTGKQAEAQRMILAELSREFGGSAEAARNTLGGALAGLKNAWGDLFEVSKADSAGIIAALNALTDFLPKVRDGFVMAFGGVRLLYVDAVNAIQQGNALIFAGISKLLTGAGSALALMPGFSDAAGALLAKAAALDTEARTLSTAFAAWKTEQEGIITGTAPMAQGLTTVSVAAAHLADNLARAATASVQLRALPPGLATAEGRGAAPGVSGALEQQALARWGAYQDQKKARALEAVRQEMEEEAQLRENFLRQWQQTFANGISDMLARGLNSWRDFFGSIRDLGIRTIADIFSRRLMEGRVGDVIGAIGGATGGQKSSGAFGLSANALAGVAGIAIGVVGIVSSLSAQADEAARARARFEAGRIEWAASLSAFADQFTGTGAAARLAALDTQRRQLEQQALGNVGLSNMGQLGAANRASQLFSGLGGGAGSKIGETAADLDRLTEAYRRNKKALEEQIALEEQRFMQDLRVRQLRASGMDKEAAALALWNQQVKEFADAIKAGFSEDLLAILGQTQAMERQRLAAEQAMEAERALADARAEYARQLADLARETAAVQQRAAEHAQQLADATEDLGVRMLRAQGQAEAADRRAFELGQKREMREAQQQIAKLSAEEQAIQAQRISGWFNGRPITQDVSMMLGAQVLALRDMQQAQVAYMRDLQSVQAAEAGAFGRGQSMPGASAAAGTAGSFHTIVSRTTAEQGDRMVDNLVTMRTLAQEFWPYLRVIAEQLRGGVNRMLGSDLTNAQALAGSAAVT